MKLTTGAVSPLIIPFATMFSGPLSPSIQKPSSPEITSPIEEDIADPVNSLPHLALDCSIFPRRTKKGSKTPAKPLNSLNDLAHMVDERFVLAYPAEPLPLVVPSWEETLVNLDYLLA
ncbi:hypothetical protein DSO57_1006619 [Entomophthora muscae]|uniref:Uncharacterized protein n=1 Tax=Entomophthora muscae TaxID=34485 RepID=A0ACC2T7E2_9FUNG|nr:hypothetical protein DSO57_1006619 [Entomophthora muscae]